MHGQNMKLKYTRMLGSLIVVYVKFLIMLIELQKVLSRYWSVCVARLLWFYWNEPYQKIGTWVSWHYKSVNTLYRNVYTLYVQCVYIYTGCHRRNGPNFGRVFLTLKYTDITQNTYIQSSTVTEIMEKEVWNFDSCYTLTDCQIHIETGRNMWFL